MTKARALLFGINYVDAPEGRLRGCVNDVTNVRDFLVGSLGFDPRHVYTYTDEDPRTKPYTTARGILTALYKLVAKSWEEDLDFVWIHYSGHGTHVTDREGDEADGQDECLVPSDAHRGGGVITDDLLRKALKRFNPKTRVFCVFDCCHSGTIADLKYRFLDSKAILTENAERPDLPRAIVALSGCEDHQTSADAYNVAGRRTFTGAMTSCLLLAMREDQDACKGNVLTLLDRVRELLKTKGFTQYPQLTCSFDVRTDPRLGC